MLYPVTIISVICIPNSKSSQKPLYQESNISNRFESTKITADSPVINVNNNAKTKINGYLNGTGKVTKIEAGNLAVTDKLTQAFLNPQILEVT